MRGHIDPTCSSYGAHEPLLIRIGEWAQNKTVRPSFLFAASFALVLAMAGAL